jgi:hypothetical protein
MRRPYFSEKVVIMHYILQKNKSFRIKIYKLYDTTGYTSHGSVPGERHKMCHNRHDSNPCYSETTDKKRKGA